MTSNGPATGVVVMLTTAVALAPASAFAVDYMSADEAAKLMFPQADRFESRTLTFDADQLRRLRGRRRVARARRAGRCGWRSATAQRSATSWSTT